LIGDRYRFEGSLGRKPASYKKLHRVSVSGQFALFFVRTWRLDSMTDLVSENERQLRFLAQALGEGSGKQDLSVRSDERKHLPGINEQDFRFRGYIARCTKSVNEKLQIA
jgi:hypothetical protein